MRPPASHPKLVQYFDDFDGGDGSMHVPNLGDHTECAPPQSSQLLFAEILQSSGCYTPASSYNQAENTGTPFVSRKPPPYLAAVDVEETGLEVAIRTPKILLEPIYYKSFPLLELNIRPAQKNFLIRKSLHKSALRERQSEILSGHSYKIFVQSQITFSLYYKTFEGWKSLVFGRFIRTLDSSYLLGELTDEEQNISGIADVSKAFHNSGNHRVVCKLCGM